MIAAYFDNIRATLIEEIRSAKTSLKIAVAWFTNHEIFNEVLRKCKDGISVELIIVCDSINIKKFGIEFNQLVAAGGKLYFGKSEFLMHHKFCIVDDAVLVNGSYNWTYWAESNDENITIIKDELNILASFVSEFTKLINGSTLVDDAEVYVEKLKNTTNAFLDHNSISTNEYVKAALEVAKDGDENLAVNMFYDLNLRSPVIASKLIGDGLLNVNSLIISIYKKLIDFPHAHGTPKPYDEYCRDMSRCYYSREYLNVVFLASACCREHNRGSSVHIYCGDAKIKLNDVGGSKLEYNKALENLQRWYKGTRLYYNSIVYNYVFFPKANIYRLLGETNKVIQELEQAAIFYEKYGPKNGVVKAEYYLRRIRNGEQIQID